jgi:antitoxin component YwqK of YwqJK toxin-antitoxin module
MSKKIHTIQSSDKKEFDKEVNFFLELGCELLEGSYEVIKKDDDVVYSQVVQFDTDNCHVSFYDSGQIEKFVSLNKDGKSDGLYTEWYENGQKDEERTYKDGKEDGKWTSWYDNGRKWFEETYKDGKLDGKWTYWFESGQKKSEETYKDGKLDGKWTYWYENGQKRSENTYKGDELDGKWTYYNEDGSIKEVKEY